MAGSVASYRHNTGVPSPCGTHRITFGCAERSEKQSQMTKPISPGSCDPYAHLPSQCSVWSFRLFLVCLAAVSVSLPMAWISLAMILLLLYCLPYLIGRQFGNSIDSVLGDLWTPWAIVAILLMFSMSLLWTGVALGPALSALVKHGKLLETLMLICLIRTSHEARIAVTAFAVGQSVLLLTSWLMVAGVPIAWATSTGFKYVVFSTYLDQSIIFATTAAVLWHLRSEQLWPRWLAGLLAGAAIINVLLMLEGRTGYAVALTVLSLSVMWAMPRRLHLVTVIATPIIILFSMYLFSTQVQNRLSEIVHESQNFATQDVSGTSTGWRLNAWHRSLQAIREKPWQGHGIGNWTATVKRLQGDAATQIFGKSTASNPHQEYLLWGVELGIGGPLLLLTLIACLVRDAMRFKTPIARATISVVAAMAVACMFNSSLYDSLIGDFFCVALGLLIALGVRGATTPSDQSMAASALNRLKVAT